LLGLKSRRRKKLQNKRQRPVTGQQAVNEIRKMVESVDSQEKAYSSTRVSGAKGAFTALFFPSESEERQEVVRKQTCSVA